MVVRYQAVLGISGHIDNLGFFFFSAKGVGGREKTRQKISSFNMDTFVLGKYIAYCMLTYWRNRGVHVFL